MANPRFLHPRLTKYARRSWKEAYTDLSLSPQGYTMEEAARKRDALGQGGEAKRPWDSVPARLCRSFCNPFSLVLLLLAVVSFLTDLLPQTDYTHSRTTGSVMLVMLLLSGLIRFWQEMRAKRAADRLLRLLETTVLVRREGRWQKLSSAQLAVGDQIRLSAGDRVPADLRLTQAKDLFLSQSMLTGESQPVEKTAQAVFLPEMPSLAQYKNIAFAGSAVIGGSGEGIVLALGTDTLYGAQKEPQKRTASFDQGANAIAGVLLRFMAVLLPLVFLACGLTKGNWGAAFFFALSVAVGLTPEMLPMVINACLAKGSAVMGRKNTIVKSISAMQAFGSMDVLCVDKTGTLTQDRLQLEYYMDVLGNDSPLVLDYAYLNSLYHTGVQNHLDQAVLRVRKLPEQQAHWAELEQKHKKLDEIPFDYERKMASVLVKDGQQSLLLVKGDAEAVCRRCKDLSYEGKTYPLPPDPMAQLDAATDGLMADGVKLLAVARKKQTEPQIAPDSEKDLTLLGFLAFFDLPKTSAADALAALERLHIPVKVLTGDHLSVAQSVCRRLSIPVENALTGEQLASMSEDERMLAVENTNVFAELTPKQKASILSALRENGHCVGFLGDGMNDLPAILEADVGIAAEGAAKTLQEAADVILLRKDLGVLEEGVLEGRKVFVNMSKYIRITASSNFGNILAVAAAAVLLPFFPMASVQLLLLNLLYDILCLILPWDSVDEELYARPRPWPDWKLGRFMGFFGPISCLFDLLTFGFLYFFLCPALCGGGFFQLTAQQQSLFVSLFQTGWFLESMWTQVLILHLLRTKGLPFVGSRPALPVLLVTAAGILVFTTLTFTPLGTLLGMTALPPAYFLFLLCIVSLYLAVVTAAKSRYVKKYGELI